MYCYRCGKQLPDESVYCGFCAARLTAESPATNKPDMQSGIEQGSRPKLNKIPLILGATVIVAAAAWAVWAGLPVLGLFATPAPVVAPVAPIAPAYTAQPSAAPVYTAPPSAAPAAPAYTAPPSAAPAAPVYTAPPSAAPAAPAYAAPPSAAPAAPAYAAPPSAAPAVPANPAQPSAVTANTYPPLTCEGLRREKTPMRYNVNAWDAASYKGDFEIGGTKYYSGIGLFLTKSQISNRYGKDEVVYSIPEGYDTASFIIGPDSNWGYSPDSGESRVTVLGDEAALYDSGWFDYSFQDTAALAIGGYRKLTITIEQTTGTKGTLNIVLGNFILERVN